jgi:hypothetical protein
MSKNEPPHTIEDLYRRIDNKMAVYTIMLMVGMFGLFLIGMEVIF